MSLEGSALRPDGSANKNLYGKEISAEDIVMKGAVHAPPCAKELLATLNGKSPKNKSGKSFTRSAPLRIASCAPRRPTRQENSGNGLLSEGTGHTLTAA